MKHWIQLVFQIKIHTNTSLILPLDIFLFVKFEMGRLFQHHSPPVSSRPKTLSRSTGARGRQSLNSPLTGAGVVVCISLYIDSSGWTFPPVTMKLEPKSSWVMSSTHTTSTPADAPKVCPAVVITHVLFRIYLLVNQKFLCTKKTKTLINW